ncbi:ABC transporter permease [Streptomyces justiciae]|uniref:ABC transporter permease n=1 Tax=Streptomyces justiciae TaxID=2780140 RepID=UPI00188239F7|nr:FtsX-like permease family protein [Streptomyces justiciae]MBE8473909.1 FtsX-like permease family protein [Streptomyces justiciae]MCW8375377.1 FtsX-like permease family protein [Streptomyces justiciae]
MLTLALRTLRCRWTTFTGSFVALSLGVALLTVMGLTLASSLDAPERAPERFAAAPVVVRGADTLRVPTPIGDRTQPLAHPRPIPPETVAALRKLGRVTQDRTFAVGDDLIGHPWSTAVFAPYHLTSGRPPRGANEVVATTGAGTAVGERLRTAHGTVRVVGTARVVAMGRAVGTGRAADVARAVGAAREVNVGRSVDAARSPDFERALFYTDARAAELAPASTQLVVDAAPEAVRRVVASSGTGARVLVGAERRLADADPDRDAEALTTLNALFGTAGGVTGFVSVFVVASTFAFAVAQRRREFGLLRTAGATPGQIRRTVLAEALLVGVLASAAGCALGSYGAPWLADRVVEGRVAPDWFTIGDHVWPYQMAFWTGLSVALCGATAASWRAGRTAPTQALREASADEQPLTRARLLCGAALLLTAAVTVAVTLLTDPGDLLHRKTYTSRPLLLITATALLSPLLVRPLIRLLTPRGMLVRANTTTSLRRTAALAAPVLVTVALTGSLLGAAATLNAARATEARERTRADYVLTSATGLDARTLDRLRAVRGAEVSPTASSEVYVLEEGVALVKSEARAADPGRLARTTSVPLTAGRLSDLSDDSIIVNEEWAQHEVGDHVTVWLGDGTRRSLRIAAVMPVGTGDNGVYVTPANARGALVDRVEARVREGAEATTVRAALRSAAPGATLLPRDAWLAATYPATDFTTADATTRLGYLLVLGIALLYTAISLANTLLMATSDRTRELTALRLAGATRTQVLRLVALESLTVVAAGAVLGLLLTALNLTGIWTALGLQSVRSPIHVPWPELGATTAACAVLAVVAAVIPAGLALRGPAGGRR